jgi:hypothetical protein
LHTRSPPSLSGPSNSTAPRSIEIKEAIRDGKLKSSTPEVVADRLIAGRSRTGSPGTADSVGKQWENIVPSEVPMAGTAFRGA